MSTALAEPTLESGSEITEATRDLWLRERRKTLGASEIAAVMGDDPYRTPLDVYLAKIGEEVDRGPRSQAAEMGLALEPYIASRYEAETGHSLTRFQVYVRYNFRSATLDAVRDDNRIVEFKYTDRFGRLDFGEEGSDEIPENFIWQLHGQMDVASRSEADLAVLIGSRAFKVYTIKRHGGLMDAMWKATARFWECVENRTPPPPIDARDLRSMALAYKEAVGQITLTDSIEAHVEEYEAIGKQVADLSRTRDLSKLAILNAMGNAELGTLPSGRTVRRQVVNTQEHTVKSSTHVRLYFKGAQDNGQSE